MSIEELRDASERDWVTRKIKQLIETHSLVWHGPSLTAGCTNYECDMPVIQLYGMSEIGDAERRHRSEVLAAWHSDELRKARAAALREAAEGLDHSTQADVNNAIGRPSPTFSHTERFADVMWLRKRADQMEGEAE